MISSKNTERIVELTTLFQEYGAVYSNYALKIGIPEASLWVLYAICTIHHPFTQYELCKKWKLPKQTINSAVHKLEKDGIISLNLLNGNLNQKALILTEKGKTFCNQNIMPLVKADHDSLANLSPEIWDVVVNSLNNHLKYVLDKTVNFMVDDKQ